MVPSNGFDSDEFDPRIYRNLPRLSPNAARLLAGKLLAQTPTPTSEVVQDAARRVRAQLEVLDAAIAMRRALASEATLQREAEFDEFVDALWSDLELRLESWSTFERPGMRRLADKAPAKLDYPRYTALASEARAIKQMLFGRGGTEFIERSYREQAAAMGRILAAIDHSNLGTTIATLVGPDLLPILRDAQTRYLEMVHARGERERDLGTSLRKLAGQMTFRIELYVIHVQSLLDSSKPETIEVVRASLQPILDFLLGMRMRGDGSDEWTYDGLRIT